MCDFENSVLLVKHEAVLQLRYIFYGLCPKSCAVQPVSILICYWLESVLIIIIIIICYLLSDTRFN